MTRCLTPQDLKCPVTGKSAYASRSRARRRGSSSMVSYRCEHCHWWHLTKRAVSVAAHAVNIDPED